MTDILDEESQLRQRLSELEQEHGDLDSAINALLTTGVYNHLQVQRLKKRKLLLKDEITRINDALLPDIIA